MRLICHNCALPISTVSLGPQHDAYCPRCGSQIQRGSRLSTRTQLAMATAGLLLLYPLLSEMLITIHMLGQQRSTSLFTGVAVVLDYGYVLVATVVLLCSLVFPVLLFILLFTMLFIDMRLQRGLSAPRALLPWLLTLYKWIQPWSLLEVYLISFLVSAFKLQDFSVIQPGLAVPALIALMLLQQLLTSQLDKERLWQYCWPEERNPDDPL